MHRTAALFCVALAAACGGEAPQCRVDADCASGVCNPDGTCAAPGGDDRAGDTQAGDARAGDLGPGDEAHGDFDTGVCLPNHDGVLARNEIEAAG